MIPETFAFIAGLTAQAHALGMEVLVEVHGHYQDQIDVARQVDWVYDFALPPLVLHTLYTRSAAALKHWLDIRPRNAITVLDTHDGIGVADVDAARGDDRSARPADASTRSTRWSRRSISAAGARAGSQAAARRAMSMRRRSTARSMMRSAAATPSTSSHARFSASYQGSRRSTTSGLLAGRQRHGACSAAPASGATSIATTTRRMNCEQALTRPVVQSLLALLRIRNTHPALSGDVRSSRIGSRQDRARLDERRRRSLAWMWTSPECVHRSRARVSEHSPRAPWHGTQSRRHEHDSRRHHVAQHGGRQDAHLSHVRDVRDDDRLGRHHHSRSHQDVSAVADRRRNVSVRDDDRNRAGGPDARASLPIGSVADPRSSSASPCSPPPAFSSPRETRSCSSR